MNAEAREILEKFERGDLFSTANAEEELETARQSARNTFNKTRRVNLRVTERDFIAHARVREEGMPYQMLLVERHPQVPVRQAHGEAVGISVAWLHCWQDQRAVGRFSEFVREIPV